MRWNCRAGPGQTWPVIRERSTEDLDECVAMLHRVHLSDAYPLVWPEDAAGWLNPANLRQSWVALDSGRIIGHAMVRERDGVVSLNRLFVAPEGRGRGVAKGLLAKARQWAKEDGVDRLVLDVVHTATTAIALYEQSGWHRTHSAPADWGVNLTVHYYELTVSP